MMSLSNEFESQVQFCRKCGEKLLGDSLFCHKCGTKVIVELDAAPLQIPGEALPEKERNVPENPQPQSEPQTAVTPSEQKQRPKWVRVLPLLALALTAVIALSWNQLKMMMFCEVYITDNQQISMVIGDSYAINYYAEMRGIPESEIEWSTTDASVAVVSEKGVVTAKGEGYASIIVSLGGQYKDSCHIAVSYKPVPVKNGEMIITPRDTGYPEVTVNAPDDEACFAYFKNELDPANDFAFYVTAGSSAMVNAPVGTYTLYYATGETWYGKDLKFGLNSAFFKSPDPIELTDDGEWYDVWEFTLYAVPDGNMETDPIDESEFPI